MIFCSYIKLKGPYKIDYLISYCIRYLISHLGSFLLGLGGSFFLGDIEFNFFIIEQSENLLFSFCSRFKAPVVTERYVLRMGWQKKKPTFSRIGLEP